MSFPVFLPSVLFLQCHKMQNNRCVQAALQLHGSWWLLRPLRRRQNSRVRITSTDFFAGHLFPQKSYLGILLLIRIGEIHVVIFLVIILTAGTVPPTTSGAITCTGADCRNASASGCRQACFCLTREIAAAVTPSAGSLLLEHDKKRRKIRYREGNVK